jgi:sigma-B regulation protein RsbU (phosphoserine phosphatase)
MTHLNHAIYNTSKGNMNMTFFIGCFDKNTKTFTYCNASHDPPYHIRKKGGQLTKKDLKPLNAANHPRLGEDPNAKFFSASIQLDAGDTVVCYTDGIVDVQNPEKERWGRRQFLANLLESGTGANSARQFVDRMVNSTALYRKDTELLDDVTFFVFRHDPRIAASGAPKKAA